MSELIPQDGYRPVINPYYKCFTDVKFDPVISSIVFFNRFIKQPVGYLDVTKFTKAADLTNVSLEVDSAGKHWLVFQRRHAPAISTDVSDLYAAVDDKLSLESANALQNKVIADKFQQILSNTLGFQSDLNILSDTYNSLDEVDSTKYRENDTIQIYDNVTSAVSYYTLVDGNFILTPRKDAAFVSTSNVDALGNSSDPEQKLTADNRVPSSKLLKSLLDLKADKAILSNYVSFVELSTEEVLSAINVSYLNNDAGYITSTDIPKQVSFFENDSGYITSSDAKSQIEDYHYITSADIPKQVSFFENDAGYITTLPSCISEYVNDVGYITGISSLLFMKDGEAVSIFNGKSNLSVDLTQEPKQQLSAGRWISIDDNVINSTLSIVGAGDVKAIEGLCGKRVIISACIPKKVSAFQNDAGYINRISSLTFMKNGGTTALFDGKSAVSVDLTQEKLPKLSASSRYLSVGDDGYTVYSTLSVEAADGSISVTEDGNAVKLSIPEAQTLTFVKNGMSSEYNGSTALVVDLASELSAGDGISIVDNKINCTMSVDVPLSVSQLANDAGYINGISSLTIVNNGISSQFDGTSAVVVDIKHEPPPMISAIGRYLSIDNNYTIYSTLSVKAADGSNISVLETSNENEVVLSVPKPKTLSFTRGESILCTYDGSDSISVDLASELSAGDGISIVDNKINCTMSVAGSGDASVILSDNVYTVSVDIPKEVSFFENDAKYIPQSVLSTLLSGITLSSDSFNELMPALGKIIEVFGGKYLVVDEDED